MKGLEVGLELILGKNVLSGKKMNFSKLDTKN